MRHHVAGLDQLVALRLLVQRGKLGDVRMNPGPHLLGLGRQVQAVLPSHTGGGALEHVIGGCVTAEQCRRDQRAAQVQMRIVLPGEPDTAVHLNIQFRVARVGRKRQCRSRSRREPELLLVLGRRAGGVPHRGDARLAWRPACSRSGA